jgi:Calcineurin-like phosphoesterase
MTTLVTGDLHVSDNPRDAYRWRFLEKTLPALIEEHAVTRVVVVGDLTEAKDGHEATLVNRLVDDVEAIARVASVYCLKGNHDYVAADVPFFRFLQHLKNVRWINEPTQLKLRGLGRCLFLPHTSRWAQDWADQSVAEQDWTFCHQTFSGADLGHGHKAEGASSPFVKKRDRVVSGDVHVPQQVGPVTYVGAPYQVDWGDQYEPRVLLLSGTGMKSVPVDGPQKMLMTLSGKNPLAGFDVGKKHPLAAALRTPRPGDVVKVRVELPSGSDLSRAQVRAAAQEWAVGAGVELHAVQVVAPADARTEKSAERPHRSDPDLVCAYAGKMGAGKVALAAGLKIVEETP